MAGLIILFLCILAASIVYSLEVREAIVYLGSVALLGASFVDPFGLLTHFEFLGAIGLLGAVAFSAANGRFGEEPKTSTMAAVLCGIWTVLALWLENSGIGFIAVGALFVVADFYAGMDHLLIMIGFKDEDVVPRCRSSRASR